MRAAMRDTYGGPEVVDVRDVEKPVPTADEVLVRVHAASVNRADLDGLYPRWAFTRLFLGIRAPKQRRVGVDIAGVVEAVGPQVTKLKPGDDVFADLSTHGAGSFAEFVCAPESAFAGMPDGLSYVDAATLPHSGILALRALSPRGGESVSAGSRVMVVGASGNVGPFCVQIAKSLGAQVTGVASADKLGFVTSLGADHVIDYRAVDYTKPATPYDWIVDVNSHHRLLRWRGALQPGGVYVALAGSAWWLLSSAALGPVVSRVTGKSMGLAFVPPFQPEDVERLKELVASGTLKPVIDRHYSLDEIVDALRYVDSGQSRGKVVITDPGGSPKRPAVVTMNE